MQLSDSDRNNLRHYYIFIKSSSEFFQFKLLKGTLLQDFLFVFLFRLSRPRIHILKYFRVLISFKDPPLFFKKRMQHFYTMNRLKNKDFFLLFTYPKVNITKYTYNSFVLKLCLTLYKAMV